MEQKLDLILKKLEEHDKLLKNLEGHDLILLKKLEDHDFALKKLEDHDLGLKKKLEDHDLALKKLEDHDLGLKKKLEDHDLALKKLDELDFIKQDLQDVKSQMNSRFDTLETKSSLLQDDVTKIKQSVVRIEENEPQDVLGMLDRIHKSQERQDKILSSLSMRSLEHETEIREIKCIK